MRVSRILARTAAPRSLSSRAAAPSFIATQSRSLFTSTSLLSGGGHLHRVPVELTDVVIKDGLKFYEGKRVFTRAEVAKHNRLTDGWLIIDDAVYNVTTWIPYHPGGEIVLVQLLGKDATTDFKGVQHSYQARDQLSKLQIGYILERKRYMADESVQLPVEFGEEGGFH